MSNYPKRVGPTQRAIIDVLREHGYVLNTTELVSQVWKRLARNPGINPQVNVVLSAAWRLAERGVVTQVWHEGDEIRFLHNLPLSPAELLAFVVAEDMRPRANVFWVLREVWW